MTQNDIAIKVSGLSKSYKGGIGGSEVKALIDFSLEVNRAEIFGLLGPNGAGKTTLVKTLLGSLQPTSGTAAINDIDICNPVSRRSVGFLPENHRFPQYMTGYQLLSCFGGMAGLTQKQVKSKSSELLELVGMSKWRDSKIRKYSKGMMQRIGLAQALLNDPEIIFLDEPTDGVDPIGRHEIREVLIELKKKGKAIFLNSHLLAEVESVCDRVAVLDKGRLLKTGPAKGLVGTKPAYRVETVGIMENTLSKIREEFDDLKIESNVLTVELEEDRKINRLIDILRENQIEIVSVMPLKKSLEESFIQLIKGAGAGAGAQNE